MRRGGSHIDTGCDFAVNFGTVNCSVPSSASSMQHTAVAAGGAKVWRTLAVVCGRHTFRNSQHVTAGLLQDLTAGVPIYR